MSYNRVLNTHPRYREQLISQLIQGSLPPYETIEPYQLNDSILRDDPLLLLLSERRFQNLDEVMGLQYTKFGDFNADLFWSSLKYVDGHVPPQKGELGELLASSKNHESFKPEGKVFGEWHQLFLDFFADEIAFMKGITKPGVATYSNEELCVIFSRILDWERLTEKGWIARRGLRTNLVSIAREQKKVLIGPAELRISERRLIGLVIHEVVIHARSAEYNHGVTSTAIEEGVGTLMEQLVLSDFYPLRLYRFMAIGLAIGVDGKKRTMREVYQLLVVIRKLLCPEIPEDQCELFVAKEVIRVYRNLPYDIPGLVYIRDKYYLEHNVAIWGTLAKEPVTIQTLKQLTAPWEDAA